jgi:phage shock protein PspC (stress-responsive transcriptional regulator)/predicted membrane protein
MTETTESIRSPVAEPRRLERSREGRWLGGVCAGLGRYFNLSPMIYRIAFVALALAGGTGILLYVAAWLVIPDDDVEDSIAAEAIKGHRDRPWLLVGVGLLGFAAILALSSARVWPSPGNLWVAAAIAGAAIVWWHSSTRDRAPSVVRATAAGEPLPPRVRRRSLGPVAVGALIAGLGIVGLIDVATQWSIDWRIVLAVAAVVLGALVAAGALTGHGVGSVVVLALAVLAAFAVAAVVRVPLFAGIGDQHEHPATIAALDSRYEQGIGNLDLQLNDVAFPAGETHVKATLGIGDLVVHVPNNVTVEVDARASVGEVDLFGTRSHGASPHRHLLDLGTNPARVLVLDARVGLGRVEVERG